MVAGFADHTIEHEIDQNRNRQDGLDLFASLLGKPDYGEGRDNADGDAYQEEQRGANQGFLVHLPVLLLVRLRMKQHATMLGIQKYRSPIVLMRMKATASDMTGPRTDVILQHAASTISFLP